MNMQKYAYNGYDKPEICINMQPGYAEAICSRMMKD